jgi:hypothetical protein
VTNPSGVLNLTKQYQTNVAIALACYTRDNRAVIF